MDLADQIQDKINALDLGITVDQGYLTGKQATEVVLYSLPGGTVALFLLHVTYKHGISS